MPRNKKAPSMRGGNLLSSFLFNKGSKRGRTIQPSETKNEAFAKLGETRQTELRLARVFFLAHPNQSFSRADLSDGLGLPINHCTRVAYDLLDEGFIEVSGHGVNPRSGVTVEMLRLKQKGSSE